MADCTRIALIALAIYSTLPAEEVFYRDDFDAPANHVNKQPSLDMGISNRNAYVTGNPLVVRSFGGITNQCLLFQGGYQGMSFQVQRGAPDYFMSFDLETHNFRTATNAYLVIGFWVNATFWLRPDGTLQFGRLYDVGWRDDERHHVSMSINRSNSVWTFKMDDKVLITDTNIYGFDDPFAIDIAFSPGEGTPQAGVDNLRIGTSATLFPLRTVRWFHGPDGTQPHGTLAYGGDRDFYGTTEGVSGYPGGVYKMGADGKIVWTRGFQGLDGNTPEAGLTIGRDGCLYGTMSKGGKHNLGTVFKMARGGELIWVTSFTGTNGANPQTQLVEGFDGDLYGVTPHGGAMDRGVVFSVSPLNGRLLRVHSFTGPEDGSEPYGRLTPANDGQLYGTTSTGGSEESAGTVFRIDHRRKLSTVFRFNGTNGSQCRAGLTQTRDGFYGVTAMGGDYNYGSVFKLSQMGNVKTLYSFTGWEDSGYPQSELVLSKDGKLYGLSPLGGLHTAFATFGTLFRITTGGEFQHLTTFHGGDGSFPRGGLVESHIGKFYGTTQGGYVSAGNVFSFEVTKPNLIVTSPKQNVRLSNAIVQMSGKTKSSLPVTNVFYCVNGGEWFTASTTNSWVDWSASVALSEGKNTIETYAVNSLADVSRTNKLRLVVK